MFAKKTFARDQKTPPPHEDRLVGPKRIIRKQYLVILKTLALIYIFSSGSIPNNFIPVFIVSSVALQSLNRLALTSFST